MSYIDSIEKCVALDFYEDKELFSRVSGKPQAVNVVNYYTYAPFGQTLKGSAALSNRFMFTGQYYDWEVGDYYLRARQYDPLIAHNENKLF